jgi:hypothetical protein
MWWRFQKTLVALSEKAAALAEAFFVPERIKNV